MPRRTKSSRRGLALIEVLICSSVCALMLTATAVAFRASISAYRDNTDRNLLLSNGRMAMRQLVDEIRQADAHQPFNSTDATAFSVGQITEGGDVVLIKQQPDANEPGIVAGNTATYVQLTWKFDAANYQVTRTRTVNWLNPVTSVQAKFVQEFKVRMEPARSPAHIAQGLTDYDLLLRAVITMKLQNVDASGKMLFNQGNGLVTERIVDAAVPRKSFSGL